MEKTKDGGGTNKIKKTSSEYRAEIIITGFTKENMHEKQNRWKHVHLKVIGIKFNTFVLK